ncbi:MAG: 2-oxo acid dehydrogenase subunit E2 [Chloroflexi bacterium]|nr:2-oxo acid dehydrogenase subunit E2 [Chloroflexota bacterium]
MDENHERCEVIPFSKERQLAADIGRMARNRFTIRGLVEVDVTKTRQLIQQYRKRTGETLSLTAFLLACVGRAVDADKNVHAYRSWRGQLVLFDEVDIVIPIEINKNNQKTLTGHIVRAANKKTLRDIQREIRTVQSEGVPMDPRVQKILRLYMALPAFVTRFWWWAVSHNPHMIKRYMGTVGFTSVGMFSRGRGGWAIGAPSHTLGITVGGIAKRPGVVDGQVEIREFLSITMDFNHEIIDGAPATRFAERLSELIESGFGLTV